MSELVAVVVPQMNPNDETAVLVCWHVQRGSEVTAGQALATLETTKATFDVGSPCDGYAFFDFEPNALVEVGAAIAWISDSDTPPTVLPQALTKPPAETSAQAGESRFTRRALRRMKELGLTPEDIPTQDRVDAAEVERVARERAAGKASPTQAPPPAADCEPLEQSSSKTIEVQTLTETYRQVVPSTVCVSSSCEKTGLRLQQLSKEAGPITLLELVIYEVARLLADFPDLNGYYENGRAWRYRSVSVGFAINLGRALRVPVVRGAAELSPVEIARAVRELSLRYMRNELQMDDVTGGTFTVTDLSGYEVVQFIPVLNHRQAAILGICAERPGTGMRDLVLSFDHRMTDGMRAAMFLAELRNRIETDPTS